MGVAGEAEPQSTYILQTDLKPVDISAKQGADITGFRAGYAARIILEVRLWKLNTR